MLSWLEIFISTFGNSQLQLQLTNYPVPTNGGSNIQRSGNNFWVTKARKMGVQCLYPKWPNSVAGLCQLVIREIQCSSLTTNFSAQAVCGQPSKVFAILQSSILPLGYRLAESTREHV